jgi:hypothetical protein
VVLRRGAGRRLRSGDPVIPSRNFGQRNVVFPFFHARKESLVTVTLSGDFVTAMISSNRICFQYVLSFARRKIRFPDPLFSRSSQLR